MRHFIGILIVIAQLALGQAKEIVGVDDTINIPPDKEECSCSWSKWMNSGPPDDTGTEDETYRRLREAGETFCESPVDIQCYNWAKKSIGPPAFSEVCNKDLGLTCSLLCDDYSVRVACCYCPPAAIGPEFLIASKSKAGCLGASETSPRTLVTVSRCEVGNRAQTWAWVSKYYLKNIETQQCLSVSPNKSITLENCDLREASQKWKYSDRTSLLGVYGKSDYLDIDGGAVRLVKSKEVDGWLAQVQEGKTSMKNMRSPPCDTALPAPVHGSISCSLGRYVSSECTFTCDYGYRLEDGAEEAAICTDDSEFTADTPNCEKILCNPAITAIEYGSVHCTNKNNLDSSCVFVCNSGYALLGDNQLMCMEDGAWNHESPSCSRITCSPDLAKDGLQFGTVNCTNAVYYDSKCTYSCNQGYEMIGPRIRTCRLNEEWDETKPLCQKIRCPPIIASSNSGMICSAGTDYSSTCKFTCDTGYVMVGSASSTCNADKTWGSEAPECERKKCNQLTRPDNGHNMSCSEGNFYGSRCSFTCDRGFKIDGEETLECTDEGWNYGAPKCMQITCSRLIQPNNGRVSCTNGELFDSICSFTCSDGFKRIGADHAKCTDKGWDNVPPVCEQITCPAIPKIKNGNIFCSKDNIVGSGCLVLCDNGYDLPPGVQNAPVLCQDTGTWSGTPAACKRIQCRDITILQGLLTCSDMNNFNSTCKFRCKEGYNMLGAKEATCTKSGWDAQAPNCGRRTCSPPLARPSNGQIKCRTSGLPVCTFSCNTGYQLVGESSSECQSDESWSVEDIPVCEIVKCRVTQRPPAHGNVVCDKGNTFGSQCTFGCDKGYTLVGEEVVTCTADKTWDSTTPTCEKKVCPVVEQPNFATMTCDNQFFYASMCRFQCNTGYGLVGSTSVECFQNSTWSASPPYCERITCKPSYSNPSNGRVDCSDGNNHGSKCTFACEEGFSLAGGSVSTCRQPGWTLNQSPTCRKISCPDDESGIPNGSRRCDHANDYKSMCVYSCNLGYDIIGESRTECLRQGTWSNTKPHCKEIQCPRIPPVKNGDVICQNKNAYNSECYFLCDDGYLRRPNIHTVRCMGNKRWNPVGFPVCEIQNKTITTTTTAIPETTTPEVTSSAAPVPATVTNTTVAIKAVATTRPNIISETPQDEISITKATEYEPPEQTTAAAAPEKTTIGVITGGHGQVHGSVTVNPGEESSGFPVIIIAVIGTIIVIVLILLIAFVVWKKRGKKKTNYKSGPMLSLKQNSRHDHTELGPLIPNSNGMIKKFTEISMDRLEMEFNRRHADDDKLFREEYHSLLDGTGSKEAGGRAKNKDKNRYTNILPYDHSRVILPKLGIDPDSDYINASFVDGYKHKGKFIAAQGPKENTIADFWRMAWEQNVSTIIMATNLEERKEPKCARYWPQSETETFGDIVVCNVGENHLVDYTIRQFTVQRVQTESTMSSKRNITQYHFTSWPDFGVPKSPSGILKFLRKIKHSSPTGYGPIVVHCSAGVGRTGTFICIDAMMDMISRENKIDVFAFCAQLRQQRPEMVQTEQQYIFIYQAILEHHLYGDTEVEASEVSGHIDDLMQRLPGNVTGMEHEFKKLTSIRIQKEHMRAGNHPANMRKNRVLLILPYDWNRVMLPIKRGQENTDYINASYIDGYRRKDAYIATQGPLPHTTEDFWRMIWDSQSGSIVMLTELVERGQGKCAQYWPDDGSAMYGDIRAELLSTKETEDYSERDFKLSLDSSNSPREHFVKQFHYHGWPEVGAPVSSYSMIELVEAVQKQQQISGNRPIVIHCSAGAGRTGAFCALSTALEQVKAEGVLDMFQIVKCLRMQRPHMVQNLEQYEFCYRAVQEYIDSMSEYDNFK